MGRYFHVSHIFISLIPSSGLHISFLSKSLLQTLRITYVWQMGAFSRDATLPFLAHLNEVRKNYCITPPRVSVSISKMLKFYVKVFYVMGKALTSELFCPCDRSCSFLSHFSNEVNS